MTVTSLLSTQQAGDFLKLSRRTLEKLRISGGGPKYVKISSRCVRYDPADLQEWINAKKRGNTYDA